jgi:hypothetical protein
MLASVFPPREDGLMAEEFERSMDQLIDAGELTVAPAADTRFANHRVTLDGETLVGRLVSIIAFSEPMDMAGMTVRLTRGGQVIAEAAVASDGSFQIDGMTPGPAGVFAFGPQGFASTGVKLLPDFRLSSTQPAMEQSETLVKIQK